MILSKKTLEKLREIINGDGTSDCRSGPRLVEFFNELGFNDIYGPGFPSRWRYTEEKLKRINGTPELDKCIRNAFNVADYLDRIDQLDAKIADFNRYLAFDKWKIVRDNEVITFKKCDRVIIEPAKKETDITEDEFLKRSFNVDIKQLNLNSQVTDVIKMRLKEAEFCAQGDAPLSSVIMIGSILEGILLEIAYLYPQQFNQTPCAPKDDKEDVRDFKKWKLSNFIDAACEIGFLKQDVKKFSHGVRDFRNYIHPHLQIDSRFTPSKQTALICLQVLKAAISQIGDYRKELQRGQN